MKVVKLGGSLYHHPVILKRWLEKFTQLSHTETIVIVPGGGPFADQVRTAQHEHGFDDAHAHHMALLAMTQFGLLLHSFLPNSERLIDIYSPLSRLNIWLPNHDLMAEPAIVQNWQVTSDSLALWLADKLNCDELFIIKCCDIHSYDVDTLSQAVVLDAAFPEMFRTTPIPTSLFHYEMVDSFPAHGYPLR